MPRLSPQLTAALLHHDVLFRLAAVAGVLRGPGHDMEALPGVGDGAVAAGGGAGNAQRPVGPTFSQSLIFLRIRR